MQVTWIIIASIGSVAFVTGLVRVLARLRPAPGTEGLPATPLERLGWVGLVVTGLIGICIIVLALFVGANDFYENGVSRGIFTILLLLGMGAWFAAWRVVSRPTGRAVIDERDRSILARSFSVETLVVILSLVAWTISLTEIYRDEGAVPIGYLQLIFWSTLVLGAFGRSLGIVLGYRQEPLIDA